MQSGRLSWQEWLYALIHITSETFFQRIYTRHLPKCLPLPKLTGKTFIVTGATSGIGLETAKQLAEAGAHVVLACRNIVAAEDLIKEWHRHFGFPINAEVMELNLLSFDSVRSFAVAWEARRAPLDVLINNAGICSLLTSQRFSIDGYEEHLQVNHLASALLTLLLLPSLLRSPSSRVVNVNSDMQLFGKVNPNDLNIHSEKAKYSSLGAYSVSKLAQVYFNSVLMNKLPRDCRIHIMCVHPGIVATNVSRTLPKFLQINSRNVFFPLTPLEGARSVLFCATDIEAVQHAESLRLKGWPLCPMFSSDCRPRLNPKRARETQEAVWVWERTLEYIGLQDDFVECVLNVDDVYSKIITKKTLA